LAPLGLWFSKTNAALPAKYRSGAFIGEHGSWDRSPLSGYEVVYVAFQDGKPVGTPETVVSGFYTDDEKGLYGAPMGLGQDQAGVLLIADDVGKRSGT
jgi:glucose/arabinose dehydrogenase